MAKKNFTVNEAPRGATEWRFKGIRYPQGVQVEIEDKDGLYDQLVSKGIAPEAETKKNVGLGNV